MQWIGQQRRQERDLSEIGVEEEEEVERHFQRQGDRNTTEEGVEVGTMKNVAYMLEEKDYSIKVL